MIELQTQDRASGKWLPVQRLHAGVNKSSGREYLSGGAVQSQATLVFTVRYSEAVAAIRLATQRYRIVYNGATYKVQDYDDYREQHRTVKLLGVSYNA